MKRLNKKGFIPIVLTAGLLLAFALVLAVAFGGTALLIWFLSQNMLVLIGASIIILSILILRQVNPWFIGIGVLMIFIPFISDSIKDLTSLEIVPSEQGVSILTGEGRSHFEVGDSTKGLKVVGTIPTTRGAGGSIMAYKIYFDNVLVACEDSSVPHANPYYCNCPQGIVSNKNMMAGCYGWTNAGDCENVCKNQPLQVQVLTLSKDVHVTGTVYSSEHVSGHDPYDFVTLASFDFMMPVYAPKTIDRYILQNCQTENPNSAGYCKGKCEANICNIENVIEKIIPIEQQEFQSYKWDKVLKECKLVTELGNKYFDTKQECEDNYELVTQDMSLWEKVWNWFKSLF